MPYFSQSSKDKLYTCHEDLQKIMNEVIKIYDFKIITGHRTEEEQNKAFDEGKSEKQWPNSKHNSLPSKAVDVAPYPIDWNNINEFYYLAGLIMKTADEMGIKLKWGGRFPKLHDCPHFELE